MRALALAIGLALTAALPAAVHAAPADVATALAAPGRTPDNVKLDANRKPAEILAFMGLEQGMRVIDMFGGNRYWAEIIAPAVGPQGQVIVWNPTQFLNDKRKADFAEFAGRQGNTALIYTPFEAPALGTNAYDFMIMNLDYHDVYWQSEERKIPRMEPQAWLARLFAAMKPGAILAIIDHAAAPGGDTREVVEKLHRIDPAVVRADFERAGFVLEGESDLLRNPADDHSLLVFDEKIRGKTDRFAFKFRKPS
ncbi:methyltransferase [Sphingomonas sp.]|uniref:class I SAM-dependent methyltransferase n=1 Tax=Sphingomonas sp. TaxID=28214 RepID=UPI00286DE55D|nr:methyltransferase [Sphingomonas sp.]